MVSFRADSTAAFRVGFQGEKGRFRRGRKPVVASGQFWAGVIATLGVLSAIVYGAALK
jgi:hypothetical protein